MGILEVQNVNKSFGGLKALHNVNLDIEEGKIHAIIGPNGAGKSTLLNCFVGKLIPDTGTVMFNGQSLLGIKPHEINQLGVSRVFQTPEIFSELSVWENTLIPCFAKRDGSFTLNKDDILKKQNYKYLIEFATDLSLKYYNMCIINIENYLFQNINKQKAFDLCNFLIENNIYDRKLFIY